MTGLDGRAFATLLRVYPHGWRIAAGDGAVHIRREGAPHVVFAKGDRSVRVDDPASVADRELVDELYARIFHDVQRLDEQWNKREDDLRALPENADFARALFDELLSSHPAAHGWSIRIDERDSVMMERAAWNKPASVLFVRRLKADKPDVQKDFVRVWIYDFEGVLRTTARTEEEHALTRALAAAARPELEAMLKARAERTAKAIAGAPKIDRAILADAVAATTHGKIAVEPIVDAVLLAAEDPARYVAVNAKACAEVGVFEPIANLHVVALLRALPRAHVLYFDWKEDMGEVLPQLADLLRAGPGIEFDIAPFLSRCAAWNRKARSAALKEIAPAITGAELLELETDGDAYSYVCVRDASRLRAWTRGAHLPLKKVRR